MFVSLKELPSVRVSCDDYSECVYVQNHVARVVFLKSRHEHVRPLLRALHWLPVKEGIIFKTTTFVFRSFDGTLPPYLSSLKSLCIHSVSDSQLQFRLREKEKEIGLCYGYRLVSVQVHHVWSNLPVHIRHCSSLKQFETSLKCFSL